MVTLDNTTEGDVERYQLFYVIARTEDIWQAAKMIYDFEKHQLKEGWNDVFDSTFRKMIKRSAHLYNSYNEDINTVDLFWGMDRHNCQTMINAQRIYLGLFDFRTEL